MKKVLLLLLSCILMLTGCRQSGIGESGISKAEFDKLSTGMTYNEVTKIIGGEGTLISESEEEIEAGHTIYTKIYDFQGETGGSATLTFVHDVNFTSGNELDRSNWSEKLEKIEQKDLK